MPLTNDSNPDQQKLLHDLKGPVSNAKGFQREALEVTSALKKRLSDNNSEGKLEDVKYLVDEDLLPCLSFIADCLTMLEQRLAIYREQTQNKSSH